MSNTNSDSKEKAGIFIKKFKGQNINEIRKGELFGDVCRF